MIKTYYLDSVDKFTKDHDIKVLKIDFNTDLVGINTNSMEIQDLQVLM